MTLVAGNTLKLNVGSGGDAISGWINVDKSPAILLSRLPAVRMALARVGILSAQQRSGFAHDVIYADATRRLPFDDHTVDYIYSSHMIEHLSRTQGSRFLAEARRVLKPAGQLRLATPDLASVVEQYRDGHRGDHDRPPADELMSILHFFHDQDEGMIKRLISRNLSGHWHQWLYDGASLLVLLEEQGFEDIRNVRYRCGEFPDLERVEIRPESLFMQAQAPLFRAESDGLA